MEQVCATEGTLNTLNFNEKMSSSVGSYTDLDMHCLQKPLFATC